MHNSFIILNGFLEFVVSLILFSFEIFAFRGKIFCKSSASKSSSEHSLSEPEKDV